MVLAVLMLLLALVGVSQAATTRSYTGTSLGPSGVGSGSFIEVVSVAVDKAHNVYVFDRIGEESGGFDDEGRVYKFDSAGAPVEFSSTKTNYISMNGLYPYSGGDAEIAVDNSSGPAAGDIYVVGAHELLIYLESGESLGSLPAPFNSSHNQQDFNGVTVGPTGDVYITETPGAIRRFAPSANPVAAADETGSMSGSGLLGSETLVTDSTGDVYVEEYEGLRKFDASQFGSLFPEGELVAPAAPETTTTEQTVGVDQADGHVFVDQETVHERSYVTEYDGSPTPVKELGQFGGEGSGELGRRSLGVAVDHASEKVYVGDLTSVDIFGPATAIPSVETEAATGISASGATFHGMVEPAGQEVTTCEFEYRPTSTTAWNDAPCEPGPPFTGSSAVPVTAHVSGLNSGTSYQVRLAGGSGGALLGASLSFVTGFLPHPPMLPDGRGYERASVLANEEVDTIQDLPPVMSPTEASWTYQPFMVALNGDAVAYMGYPAETGGVGKEGAGFGNQYISRRQPGGGWSATDVSPLSLSWEDIPVFRAFTPDLTGGFVTTKGNALGEGAPGEEFSDLYYTTFGTGKYTAANTVRPPHRTAEQFGSSYIPPNLATRAVGYGGSTPDRSHVLFAANDALTPNAPLGGVSYADNLYDSSEGKLTLVNVKPNGTASAGATFGGTELEELERNGPVLNHDISEDGKRIFWTGTNSLDLYVRENDTAPAESCSVSGDACTKLIGEEAQFWDATPNGSKVLYTQEGGLHIRNLETEETEELASGGVRGVVAETEDLGYVYFVASAALAPGAEAVHCELYRYDPGDRCNLYVLHVGEAPKFIAQLTGHDNFNNPESEYTHAGDWEGSLGWQEAEVTPDGMHLVFTSNAHLTGYNNKEASEVFVYDYASGTITCTSCKASGEEVKTEGAEGQVAAFLPVSHVPTALPHWMSDDGNRVFFDSVSALVPQDTNTTTDVYEWERDGVGSCGLSPGCIYLISSGSAKEGSWLIGASTSGDDVFFTTRSKMVSSDENEYVDVYDARVGAKLPPTPPTCTGTGCQGVPSAPPVFATPPSQTYSGVGNFESVKSTSVETRKVQPLTRAQKLNKALRACRKKRQKQRAACERYARKRYGGKAKKSSSSKRQVQGGPSSRRGK